MHGPEQEIIFEQWHIPGERGQSDFTYMDDLGIMSAALPMKMGMWNKRTNISKLLPIRHCERVAVKISNPKIIERVTASYQAVQ